MKKKGMTINFTVMLILGLILFLVIIPLFTMLKDKGTDANNLIISKTDPICKDTSYTLSEYNNIIYKNIGYKDYDKVAQFYYEFKEICFEDRDLEAKSEQEIKERPLLKLAIAEKYFSESGSDIDKLKKAKEMFEKVTLDNEKSSEATEATSKAQARIKVINQVIS